MLGGLACSKQAFDVTIIYGMCNGSEITDEGTRPSVE